MSKIVFDDYELEFGYLVIGTYFMWEDDLYLKISSDSAFEFGNDVNYRFNPNDKVTVIDENRIEVRVRR